MDFEDGSAFGPELDFLAPGVEVYNTYRSNTYGLGTGTSYANPATAGVAALVLTVEPELRWNQLRDRMRSTCDKIGPLPYAGRSSGDGTIGMVTGEFTRSERSRRPQFHPHGQSAALNIELTVRESAIGDAVFTSSLYG
jgi:subtilisin family serine protease